MAHRVFDGHEVDASGDKQAPEGVPQVMPAQGPQLGGVAGALIAAPQGGTVECLGTAVIPIAYEDVLRLAEELLTLDHLSSHRLAASDGISVVVPSELPTPAARELLTIIAKDVAPRYEAAVQDATRS